MAINMFAIKAGKELCELTSSCPAIGVPIDGAILGGAAGGFIGHKINDEYGGAIGGGVGGALTSGTPGAIGGTIGGAIIGGIEGHLLFDRK